jgi:hypothetical protein
MILEMIDAPPRPKGGNGDVIVNVGGQDVRITWTNGKITKAEPVLESLDMVDGKLTHTDPLTGETFSCIKCIAIGDPTTHIYCFPVPC